MIKEGENVDDKLGMELVAELIDVEGEGELEDGIEEAEKITTADEVELKLIRGET